MLHNPEVALSVRTKWTAEVGLVRRDWQLCILFVFLHFSLCYSVVIYNSIYQTMLLWFDKCHLKVHVVKTWAPWLVVLVGGGGRWW